MMNSGYYNIVYARTGVLLHPSFLRDELTVILINALLSPIDDVHAQFTTLKNNIDFNTYSQVCYMQGVLNDSLDPLERRIRIKNAHLNTDYYLYWKQSKSKPVKLCKEGSANFIPRIENGDFQIGSINIDFEVILPVGYSLSEEEKGKMDNLVNQSKLASKRYRITNGQD